jgi:CheY-like chemotaxis protein
MDNDVVILVADDEKGHYVLTKNSLRRGGIDNDIIWLEDGQATLDFLRGTGGNGDGRDENKGYVLLLDIRMPKVDGVEVLRRMKADDELRDIPVLMVTTSDAPVNIDICTQLGCNGYFIKPLDETLIETVRQVCRHLCTHPHAGR